MPKSQLDSKNEGIDEKTTKIPTLTQPNAAVKLEQEHAADMTSEGHRILGMTKENSGWDVYNNEARKVDTELVKDWTTSLNFLLIFAAIFAAVLTAFIIESKKMLEQDPTETMVAVMIFYVGNVANGTHTPYNRTAFEPSTPAIVVNSLFFGSLSASLLAALASVVALQWVADYDAAITRGGSSPEDRAKRRQFRYAGVVWWKMSEIIAALPLLLYFSVMLFFAGLILWMWDTNHTVGVVVAGGTAIAVLFYVTSTMIAVAFVSAPFRTPLSRLIYNLWHLPISALYWLMRVMHISTIPDWIKTRHSLATRSYRREDRAVENTDILGRDALIWLANQISISQDSYRRLLLLVGELPCLNAERLPSFDSTEALWYRIFDLLGWRYLRRGSSAIVNAEERRHGMEILQRCYKIPVIQNLVDPVEREELRGNNHDEYWSLYCDSAEEGQWTINQDGPNHLFLLLRDIPCPSEFSALEIKVTARLSEWRNRRSKDPHAWDEVFSNATSLPTDFFSACVATFGNYCTGEKWYLWDDEREMRRSLARKVVQKAVLRDDFLPLATGPLVRAYEAILVGYSLLSEHSDAACLISQAQYGKVLQESPADDHATHESIILLLSRQIHSTPEVERAVKVRDIITMLWLRPSNLVPRNWDYLWETQGWNMDVETTSDWINHVGSTPHIVEILRHLASAQKSNPTIGPLWRTTVPGQVHDPHFVEAVQTLDHLMGTDCSDDDHYTLINLICQDLEQEPYPDFDDYFTPNRLDSLTSLEDPCLKILVQCARGPDFLSPVTVPETYGKARRSSLTRVAEYVYKQFSTIDSPAALQFQASLASWGLIVGGIYAGVLQDTIVFDLLRRMFRYPVPCYGCLDGPGHLISHLLNGPDLFPVTQKVTLFGKIPLEGHHIKIALILLSTPSGGEVPSLGRYFPQSKEHILRKLQEEVKEILCSQFHLLVMVWNSVEIRYSEYPEDVAAILAGIQKALQLPPDWRSTLILAPLSLKIRRLSDTMLTWGPGSFAEREFIREQVDIMSQLLLSNLAVRSIFGRHNSNRVSCARAIGEVQPVIGWLPLYEG